MSQSETEKFEMLEAMRQFGGSFVVALSECFALADLENTSRLYEAFSEYVKQYSEMAAKLKKRNK